MPEPTELKDLKEQIKAAIRRNSDRGFVPYGKCIRVSNDMMAVADIAEGYVKVADYRRAFDIYIMLLLETVQLISHADDSSGCCGDLTIGGMI